MKHFFLFLIAVFVLAGCTAGPTYNYASKGNNLQFKIGENKHFVQPLDNPTFRYTFDGCTNHSYVLKEKRYFIEYISLDTNCKWNGLSSGFFERQFKDKLKLKSLTALERFDIKNYTFSTLKVNDKYVMNIITVYTAYTDAFIIDYEGVLYEQLLSELKPDYKNAYKTMPRFNSDYDYSLVRFNVFEGYFSRDADIFGK